MNSFDTPVAPWWATGSYKGALVPGTQLNTRDGRRIGNAVVVKVEETGSLLKDWLSVTIVTDFGNKEEFAIEHIECLFHEPKWVMDIHTHTGYNAWQEDIRLGRD